MIDALVKTGVSLFESQDSRSARLWWPTYDKVDRILQNCPRISASVMDETHTLSLNSHDSRLRQFLGDAKYYLAAEIARSILLDRLPTEVAHMILMEDDYPDLLSPSSFKKIYASDWPRIGAKAKDECLMHRDNWEMHTVALRRNVKRLPNSRRLNLLKQQDEDIRHLGLRATMY